MPKRSRTKKLMEKANDNIGKIAGIVSGLVVIIGALTGTIGWLNSQLKDAIATQISEFREETKQSDRKQEQAITRVELITLMEHDPYNTIAIEKMAKYYFQELDGDLYMTQRFSDWAKAYDGDISIIIGVK